MRPICIDLFCGLGGWTRGFLSEGYQCIGFDVERHVYGEKRYPAQLVLQDVLTLHGAQFRDVAAIVASPPCQRYSWMAMPFSRGKREAAWQRWERDSALGDFHLNDLFDACFRIQREACEAANGIQSWGADCQAFGSCGRHAIAIGHFGLPVCSECSEYGWKTYGPPINEGPQYRYIPMVVENVKGAQPWVGKAKANYGSFYLWGDVRSVGGRIVAAHRVEFGAPTVKAMRGQKFNPDGTQHGQGSWFAVADSKNRGAKNAHVGSGSWFPISHGKDNGETYGAIPNRGQSIGEGQKVPGMNFHDHEKTGNPGRSFQSAAVDGLKNPGMTSWSDHGKPGYKPAGFNVTAAQRYREQMEAGVKQGGDWFGKGEDMSISRRTSSKSSSRKAASAAIAEIPFELAAHIARCFKPSDLKEGIA